MTANQNTFERKDIVIEVANNSRNGVGSWLSDIDAVSRRSWTAARSCMCGPTGSVSG